MDTILWSIDNQNDFINENGLLAIKDAKTIRPNLAALMQYARENNIFIVHTADWHDKNTKEISENPDFMNTFPKHCMADTKGAELITETKPKGIVTIGWDEELTDEQINELKSKIRLFECRELLILKDKFDVFEGNPNTQKIVNMLTENFDFKRAIVCGVATNVCVNFAVLGLVRNKKIVYVVSDAIKELPNIPTNELFEKWHDLGVHCCITKYSNYSPNGYLKWTNEEDADIFVPDVELVCTISCLYMKI